MFLLKQILKQLFLPPTFWIVLLVLVVIFWRRRWARVLLLTVTALIIVLHNGTVNNKLRYPLEARYPVLEDPRKAAPYDAIVVLLGNVSVPTPLTPFPPSAKVCSAAWTRRGGSTGFIPSRSSSRAVKFHR
jgi:hypothetical protein